MSGVQMSKMQTFLLQTFCMHFDASIPEAGKGGQRGRGEGGRGEGDLLTLPNTYLV